MPKSVRKFHVPIRKTSFMLKVVFGFNSFHFGSKFVSFSLIRFKKSGSLVRSVRFWYKRCRPSIQTYYITEHLNSANVRVIPPICVQIGSLFGLIRIDLRCFRPDIQDAIKSNVYRLSVANAEIIVSNDNHRYHKYLCM